MSGNENDRIAAYEARIAALEAQLAERNALVELLFDHSPDCLAIAYPDGRFQMNEVAAKTMGGAAQGSDTADLAARYGLFQEDGVTPCPEDSHPIALAMRTGEAVPEVVVYSRSPFRPEGVYLAVRANPLPGGGGFASARDITERRAMEQALAERAEDLAKREEENRELIARLRVAVDELSTPVLEIWNDVLALPVVGLVDTQRSAAMTERLLSEVVRNRAQNVVVDLTGVELIDTSTADRFIKLARSVQLLGSRCIITGIQPAVAQTLVELGVEFAQLETHRNLKSALEACIRRAATSTRGSHA